MKALSKISVDSNFDDDWKQLVENKINDYSRISGSCGDNFWKIEERRLQGALRKLK